MIVDDVCKCDECLPSVPVNNTGHGHVRPRPDGMKARCGGPGLCSECSREAAQIKSPPLAPGHTDLMVTPESITFACGGYHPGPVPRRIIAFSGLAGSGKSTAALHLVNAHNWARVRFAGPLKDMCRALGLTEAEIEGDRKEVPCELLTHRNFHKLILHVRDAFYSLVGFDWDSVSVREPFPLLADRTPQFAHLALTGVLARVVAFGEAKGGATPRLLMQMIGTEWGRDLIAPDIWTEAWKAAVARVPAGMPVVVDDCRFPNEAETIHAVGGHIVGIVRPGAGAGAAGHVSESYKIEPVISIRNNRTLENFLDDVDSVVRDLSWVTGGDPTHNLHSVG